MDNLISVIMPVYNAEQYLACAIESVLNQTYSNFEFIIIDDGSSDNSAKIIEDYAGKDLRIRFYKQKNMGLVFSLNKAIGFSRGKYIARMDADDICMPERFEKQYNLMLSTGSSIVGCNYILINEFGYQLRKTRAPSSRSEILLNLVYSVPFAHSSVFGLRSFFYEYNFYPEKEPFSLVEDYSLWTIGYSDDFVNVDEDLLLYRVFDESFSSRKRYPMYKATKFVSNLFVEDHLDKILESIKNYNGRRGFICRSVVFLSLYSPYRWKVLGCILRYHFSLLKYLPYFYIREIGRVVRVALNIQSINWVKKYLR